LNEERLRSLYQHSLGDRMDGRRLDCPSVRELAGLAYETTAHSRRVDLARHVARCLQCTAELNRMVAGEHATALASGASLRLVDEGARFVHAIEESPT